MAIDQRITADDAELIKALGELNTGPIAPLIDAQAEVEGVDLPEDLVVVEFVAAPRPIRQPCLESFTTGGPAGLLMQRQAEGEDILNAATEGEAGKHAEAAAARAAIKRWAWLVSARMLPFPGDIVETALDAAQAGPFVRVRVMRRLFTYRGDTDVQLLVEAVDFDHDDVIRNTDIPDELSAATMARALGRATVAAK